MDEQNLIFPFTNLPTECITLKEGILNEDLKKLYSQFKFICFDKNEDSKQEDKLYDFLKANKFFVYTKIISEQKKNIFDSILCFENYCLFIEFSKINSFKQIYHDENFYFIDLNSPDENIREVKKEISPIYSYFQRDIKSNEFVKLTFQPIVTYMIRRYFLPTNYFKDPSFFSFKQNHGMDESDFSNFNSEKMLKKIIDDKNEINKTSKLDEFEEKDFIQLQQIYCHMGFTFNLVVHITSFYIFMMKIIKNGKDMKSISHEIDFNKEYSHRCMTKFYGFVKEKEKIVGFIYEFMSNGTLVDYFSKNKESINAFFPHITVIRIAQAIKYLHSNSLIHRDIKPLNILIDHDNIPYLSDFDTITKITNSTTEITSDLGSIIYSSPEQYSESTYSFPTDIYSFGQLIYFIYEKEDNLEGSNNMNILNLQRKLEMKKENKIPKYLQKIFNKCISIYSNNRPLINDIIDFLCDEAKSFHFLGIPFFKKIIHDMNKSEIIQYFKEMYYLLFIDGEYKNNHEIELFQILNIINNVELSQILCSVGQIYYDGKNVQQDFHKAKEYFDLSSEMNNANAFYYLGNIYHTCKGVVRDYTKARQYYEKAVEQNHYLAMNNLGNMYQEGSGVAKDIHKALVYFEIAAQHNNYFAMCSLGMLYLNGIGVEKNVHKAKEYFELAAKHNNRSGFNNLGVLYRDGSGVEQSFEKAKEYFELAAKQKYPLGLCNLGMLYMNGLGVEQSFEKAKECFELAAEQNFPKAHLVLGVFYMNGLGSEQSFEKAKEYFEFAAEQNEPIALSNLGFLYNNGFGVEQSYEKAKKYYELAAKQNEPNALNNLGELYLLGCGAERNFEKARYYFELAAKQNFEFAKYNLGLIYKKGLGVPKDYSRARYCFDKTSSDDNPLSLYQLGTLYYHGLGVKQDISKAKYYFEKSAKQNYDRSLYKLGLLYRNGDGVDLDYKTAFKYFELSAFQNNPKALYQMGILHFYCLIENHDYKKAREYFEMSSKNNMNSNFYLGIIYEKGIGVDRDLNKAIEYYKQCSNTEKTKYISIFQSLNLQSYDHKYIYNDYYYQSNNALGLIYITEKLFQSKELAEDYFKKSGLYNHPFGQNSLGIYRQFYSNQIDDAQHFFEEASKSHFAISEYNLAYIYEEKGKIEESIEHYINASNFENDEVIFRNHKIEDERLEISKLFIICYTNLKLSHYYLSKSELALHEDISNEFILKAIFRPLFCLIFHSKKHSYRFYFKTIKKNEKLIITNLKEFIMSNPLFHYENDTIIDRNDSNDSYKAFGWIVEEPKQDNILELNLKILEEQPSDSLNNNDHTYNNHIKKKYLDECKDEQNRQKQGECESDISILNYNEKIDNIFRFMNKQNKFEVINNEKENNKGYLKHYRNVKTMIIQKKSDCTKRFLNYPKKLSEIIIKTITEDVEEMKKIIEGMKIVLYKEPYKILFGRIGIYEPEEGESSNNQLRIEEINSNFYEGIGNDLFYEK